MKKVKNYTIEKESIQDMCDAGRFNPSSEITYRDKTGIQTHKIDAGCLDDIHVCREGMETFVLTTNQSLPYVGLEVFTKDGQAGDLFFQGDQVLEAGINLDLMPYNIIKELLQYI